MNLDQYRSKRRFPQTPEPAGDDRSSVERRAPKPSAGEPDRRFVIHKHDATKLHFDLRLEHAGVLLCWAVPRGPSLDPQQRRLAIQTEDHPIDYLDFEGLIPEGNYGAGPMIVWDQGRWTPEKPPEKALAEGKLKLTLEGQRLQGRWTLVRTGGTASRHWLLIKEKEPPRRESTRGQGPQGSTTKTEPVVSERTSVASGRTLAQLRGGAQRGRSRRTQKSAPASIELPQISPKLPTLVERPPRGDGWLHELKLDGYRMQIRVAGGHVTLLSRNGHDWTDRLPELADAVASLPMESAILDGELVALTAEGATDFSSLQSAFAEGRTGQLVLYFFDLLYLDGRPLVDRPLRERKVHLEPLIRDAQNPRLQYLDHLAGSPSLLWQACRRRGLEGIVSKRADRPYRGGRAPDWLKTKYRRRDRFVIGGFERSKNAVAGLGALGLGYFDPRGRLIYCGKVGGGWSAADGQKLVRLLEPDRRDDCPFDPPPKTSLDWLHPRIVVEVAFAGVTDEGNLRQASLVSTHPELPADSVVRDTLSTDVAEGDLVVSDAAPAPSSGGDGSDRKSESRSAAPAMLESSLGELFQRVKVTSPQRVLFPDAGITKLELIAYLVQINQWLLPHVQDRVVSLVRCPDGITGETFFQRHPGRAMASAIEPVRVEGSSRPLLRIRSVEGLMAAAQMNAIEIHPWGSRLDRLDRPDRIIFDLDPDTAVPWPQVVDAAWILRDALRDRNLDCFVKTTGGKGLHVVVPIARRYSWERVGQWCRKWVDAVVAGDPQRFTGNASKRARRGKIFIDYHRNRRGATAVAAYGVRARAGAPVSVPLHWEELTARLRPDHWTLRNVPERLKELDADPWAGLASMRQSLK